MSEQTIPELTKLQLQQSIETYRVQMTLLVQICTVLVVADATTVGYAIQQRLAGIIWVGTLFPITMSLVIQIIFRLTLPVLATAVAIETRFHEPGSLGLMSHFVAVGISPTFFARLRTASLIENESERVSALQTLRRPSFSGLSPAKWILRVVMVGQIVAPLLLWHFVHWRLLTPLS